MVCVCYIGAEIVVLKVSFKNSFVCKMDLFLKKGKLSLVNSTSKESIETPELKKKSIPTPWIEK